MVEIQAPPSNPDNRSREVQRVERMQMQYNKLVDRLQNTKDREQQQHIKQRMAELLKDIEVTQLEAQAVLLKKRPVGANVEVPLKKFNITG